MLHGNTTRIQDPLQRRDIQPEDGHGQREQDCREEKQILSLFVEGWWVGENGETSCSDGHEVEPLPVYI